MNPHKVQAHVVCMPTHTHICMYIQSHTRTHSCTSNCTCVFCVLRGWLSRPKLSCFLQSPAEFSVAYFFCVYLFTPASSFIINNQRILFMLLYAAAPPPSPSLNPLLSLSHVSRWGGREEVVGGASEVNYNYRKI